SWHRREGQPRDDCALLAAGGNGADRERVQTGGKHLRANDAERQGLATPEGAADGGSSHLHVRGRLQQLELDLAGQALGNGELQATLNVAEGIEDRIVEGDRGGDRFPDLGEVADDGGSG